MTLSVRSSGTWVAKTLLYVRVSGAWVAKTVGYKRVSGVWVEFLAQLVNLTSRTISVSYNPSTADASLRLDTGGNAYTNVSGVGDTLITGQWRLSGVSSDYDARWTPVSGTPNYLSDPVNTWLSLGTSRRWGVSQSPIGTNTAVGTVEIRQTSSGVTLATATITVTATRT